MAARLLTAMALDRELLAYKKTLLGCCRLPEDALLKRRLTSFAVQHPKFRAVAVRIIGETS
jgi:hypothetical protein